MSDLAIVSSEDLKPRVPAAYERAALAVETDSAAGSGWQRGNALAAGMARPVPLWIFRTDDASLRSRKAVAVRIRSEGNFVFAGNDSLAIEGTGLTTPEAIDDFCLHVTHFYKYYKGLAAERLTGDALRLKALFSDLFVEI